MHATNGPCSSHQSHPKYRVSIIKKQHYLVCSLLYYISLLLYIGYQIGWNLTDAVYRLNGIIGQIGWNLTDAVYRLNGIIGQPDSDYITDHQSITIAK